MDHGTTVEKIITSGNNTGISDGSFKQHRDIPSCMLEADNTIQSIIYSVHNKPGNQIDQSPYLSELQDISMMLVVIQCVISSRRIKKGSIRLE